jgi:hypothetical protein
MKHRDLVQECFYVSRILGGSFISSCIQHHKVFLGISSTIANIGPSSIPLNFLCIQIQELQMVKIVAGTKILVSFSLKKKGGKIMQLKFLDEFKTLQEQFF